MFSTSCNQAGRYFQDRLLMQAGKAATYLWYSLNAGLETTCRVNSIACPVVRWDITCSVLPKL